MLRLTTLAVVHFERSQETSFAKAAAPSHRACRVISKHPDSPHDVFPDLSLCHGLEREDPCRRISRLDHDFAVAKVEVRVQQRDAKPLDQTVPLEHAADLPQGGHVLIVERLDLVDVAQCAPLDRSYRKQTSGFVDRIIWHGRSPLCLVPFGGKKANIAHSKSNGCEILRNHQIFAQQITRHGMHPPNPRIPDFDKRVEWMVENLDPEPSFRRFVIDPNDIFTALEDAARSGLFAVALTERVPHRRTWQLALQNDSVPSLIIEWICALYPDMTRSQLLVDDITTFLALGEQIEKARERWKPAVRLYAEERAYLSERALEQYREFDSSGPLAINGIGFPLLTQDGWVRSTPIELSETSEDAHLLEPEPARKFAPPKLVGLQGSFASYKGALAYRNRRVIKTEPQHNGEIFCAYDVVQDESGFVGFRYQLAKYFDYINTCEVLGAELADSLLTNPKSLQHVFLPLRGDPARAFDFSWRAAYPSVNCLAIFLNYSDARRPKGNYFLLHKRDETQLQAQNTVHVVPAGGHQGFAAGSGRRDTALWRTIVREFCEELFNVEDLYKQPDSWEDFLLHPRVAKIRDVCFREQDPAARIWLHGFGLDPVTLKPEVIATIVVDWAKVLMRWERPKIEFNWELQKKVKKDGTRDQWVPLSKAELLRQARGSVQSLGDRFLSTLPAGAACLLQTHRHYDLIGLPQ
jgi:hypothetical protein